MNKILILLVICLLLPLTQAGVEVLKPAKVNYDYQIQQVCTDATYINVSVSNINGLIIVNKAMTANGSGMFLYNFTPDTIGRYDVNYLSDGCEKSITAYLDVTVTGKELTTSKSITYIIIFIISFIIFLAFLIAGIYLPSNNKKDEFTGYVIAVSNVKYLKIFSFTFSYLTALFISYFSWMVCYAYLDMDFMTKIFQFIFYFLAIATLPLFILLVYLLISNLVRDSKLNEMLSRGLNIK